MSDTEQATECKSSALFEHSSSYPGPVVSNIFAPRRKQGWCESSHLDCSLCCMTLTILESVSLHAGDHSPSSFEPVLSHTLSFLSSDWLSCVQVNEYDCLLLEFVFGNRPDDAQKVRAYILETIASDPGLQQTELVFLGLFGRSCRILENKDQQVCIRNWM